MISTLHTSNNSTSINGLVGDTAEVIGLRYSPLDSLPLYRDLYKKSVQLTMYTGVCSMYWKGVGDMENCSACIAVSSSHSPLFCL